MALKQIDYGTDEYREMVKLRTELLRKPLGISFDPAELAREVDDVLIGAFEDERMLGCCLLNRVNGNTMRLRQMAVPDNHQGKGIGRALMVFAENLARDMGFRTIMMHARETAIGFYQKQGYIRRGDIFTELTIPHCIMEKPL